MLQKIQYSYTYLAFFKEDIQKLVRLFQMHLQDVDCVIDKQHILNETQFEQYVAQLESINPSYQIRSLEAQGVVVMIQEGADVQQSEPPRINLSINKKQATLIVWKEVDDLEPGVASEMRELFASRVNRVYQTSVICSLLFTFLTPSTSILSFAQQHHLNFFREILFGVAGGIPLGMATFTLLIFVLRFLRLDTRIFLLPAVVKPIQKYRWRETISTIVVALILIVLMNTIISSAIHILWR